MRLYKKRTQAEKAARIKNLKSKKTRYHVEIRYKVVSKARNGKRFLRYLVSM